MKILEVIILAVLSILPIHQQPHPELSIVVRPTDLDVKGHVNNARYVEYLQWSRWDWMDRYGLTNEKLLELNTVLVVVNININYRHESKYGDTLKTLIVVKKIGEKSFVLQQIIKKDDLVIVDAEVIMVAVDLKTRKSRLIPEELKVVLDNNCQEL